VERFGPDVLHRILMDGAFDHRVSLAGSDEEDTDVVAIFAGSAEAAQLMTLGTGLGVEDGADAVAVSERIVDLPVVQEEVASLGDGVHSGSGGSRRRQLCCQSKIGRRSRGWRFGRSDNGYLRCCRGRG